MILRLPHLIARLAELDGTMHRKQFLVEVDSLEDVLAINRKLFVAWNKHKDLPYEPRLRLRKSLEVAEYRVRLATFLLTQEGKKDGKT